MDVFADWYDSAGVRNGPRRIFAEERDHDKVFFPKALVPYLGHDLVRGRGPDLERELTIRHLYQFLLATTHLETRVVNRGAERIANNRVGVPMPGDLRQDAFKVYCDEGYHSLYSLDLARQVQVATGVAVPDWDFGGFAERLDATAARLLPGAEVLAQLLQVVVFETLITAVLNELPADPRVLTTVRELARDHARDEGRHHRYFAGFFRHLWTHLDRADRARAAVTLPALIEDCLRWDAGPVHRSLTSAGLTPAEADTVVRDCYGGAPQMRQVASATVRLFRSTGVLDQPGAREAFAERGLIDD